MTEHFRAILPPNGRPPRLSQMTTARLMLLTGVLAGSYSSWNIGVSLFTRAGVDRSTETRGRSIGSAMGTVIAWRRNAQ